MDLELTRLCRRTTLDIPFGIVVSLPHGSERMNKVVSHVIFLPDFGRSRPASFAPLRSSTAWRRLALALLLACVAAASPLMERSYAANTETTATALMLSPQVSRANSVTVTVTPPNTGAEAGTWNFKVVLDTHSQDLQDDLLKSAALVDDSGNELRPIAWQGSPPGGHHREGLLQFNAPEPRPARITLRLQRPNELEPRTFTWAAR